MTRSSCWEPLLEEGRGSMCVWGVGGWVGWNELTHIMKIPCTLYLDSGRLVTVIHQRRIVVVAYSWFAGTSRREQRTHQTRTNMESASPLPMRNHGV